MSRGRPRKSVDLKILDGTFRPDRDGSLEVIVTASGAPVKPEALVGLAGEFWDAWVPKLVASGVAKEIDGPELARMCQWWDQSNRLIGEMAKCAAASKRMYRLQYLAAQAEKMFESLASKFGFNPSDRAKLRLEKPKKTGVPSRNRTA